MQIKTFQKTFSIFNKNIFLHTIFSPNRSKKRGQEQISKFCVPGILLGDGEEMLEDGHGSLAQSCLEVVEDQMGIGFRHRACTTKKLE